LDHVPEFVKGKKGITKDGKMMAQPQSGGKRRQIKRAVEKFLKKGKESAATTKGKRSSQNLEEGSPKNEQKSSQLTRGDNQWSKKKTSQNNS